MNVFFAILLAATLPTFSDFRRIDRDRRTTGRMQTPEYLEIMRPDAALIQKVVAAHPDDPAIVWGAAELLTDWPTRRALFESALRINGTNLSTAVRFADVAARERQLDLALTWYRHCESNDVSNIVPRLGEAWALRHTGQPPKLASEGLPRATDFRDYGVEASYVRIQVLRLAGYSPYAARRLGFTADSMALRIAQEFARPPVDEAVVSLLKDAAYTMQQHPKFFLTELVGQTLERAVMAQQTGGGTNAAMQARAEELDDRRDVIKEMVATVETNAIELATEEELVAYFDAVLVDGEELAMKWLTQHVRQDLGR